MKTRLLALLTALILLITCAAFAVSASGSSTTAAKPIPFVRGTDACPCCGKTTGIDWVELTDNTSGNPNLAAGHYVVTNPLNFTGGYYNITGSKNVVIVFENVLTGKSGSNVLRVGMGSSTFANCKVWLLGGTIKDAADDAKYKYGAIIGTGASASLNGSLMRMGKGADVTIGGALTVELSASVTSGNKAGLFDIYSGKVTMTGGVLNGISSTSSSTTYGAVVIRSGGTFIMSGGTINGGSATKGNAVFTNGSAESGVAGGTFTMSGGTINGGAATDGGAIYHGAGTMTISGGTINGGTVTNGGAIYLADGNATISGGTINGGTATNGGAIYVAGGTLTMQSDANNANGSIAEKGGAIYLDENATFTMTKGTVKGCNITNETTTVVNGGAIYTKASGETALTLTGGTVNGGTIARAANTEQGITALNGLGGAVYMEGGTVTLGGTAVTGGTAYDGGCIYKANGTLTIAGSAVSQGYAFHDGGSICSASGAVILNSGSVSQGDALNWGGNIKSSSAMSVTGGSVSGGDAKRGGNIYVGSTFTMSGGTVEDGTATQYAGNIFIAGNKDSSITGGTIEDGTSQGNGNYYGGNLHVYACKLSISDTAAPIVIRNGTAYSKGGNISVMESANVTINLTGNTSEIAGGSAVDGAGIYNKGTVTLTSGKITGGTATNGGAVYVAAGTATVNGATVTGGTATNGGAVYVADGTFTMDSGTLNGTTMKADSYGGTIYLANGEAYLNAGTVNGGTVTRNNGGSSGRGGAIYVADGELHLDGANIVGGKAKEGGCLFIAGTGYVSMTAGGMSLGDATSNGGTVFINGATMDMSGGTITANPNNTYNASRGIRIINGILNLSGNATVISAAMGEGDGVYVVSTNDQEKAKVTLAGNATVRNPNGTNVNNIFLSNYNMHSSKIEIAAAWQGAASVKFGYIYSNDYVEDGAAYSVGMSIPVSYAVAAGEYTGSLRMEIAEGQPNLWWDGTNGVKASNVQIVKKVDGRNISFWEKNNDAAVAAYDGGYIKLLNTDSINLQGKDVYVDFNGNDVTVTLSGGKLYGMDNTASVSGAGRSQVTVADGDPEMYAQNPVTGQHMIALPSNGTVSFHTVDVGIDSVSLRPGAAGIYYGASFRCDDVLKVYVDCFGVAVSLTDMPDTNFDDAFESLYTMTDGEKLGKDSYNSVIVQNIMKDQAAATNKNNAQKPIYASAYMKLNINGQTYTMMGEATAQMSLKDVLQRIDKQWHGLNETARNNVITQLYDTYIAKFDVNDWGLVNLEAEKLGLDKNRELKILTIGNSLAVDATRMLAYVAQQEGSVGIKVGTLYKANCSVQEHADFLTNDKPNYWYYESGFDAQNPGTLTSGSLVPRETRNYKGYDAVVAQDWDIIVMQHSVFGSGQPETYDESINTIIDYVNTHKTNPNAIFVWNMTWMPPVDDELLETAEVEGRSPGFGKSYRGYTKDPLDREAQTMMYDMISGAVAEKIRTDNRFAYVLPSATMMQNALTATSDKVMYRDYIHGSDYGRLMNAYLWYSMFANKTITEPAVDMIPGKLRQASANQSQDLALTQRMRNILVESVNNAKADPYGTTQSAYQKNGALKVLAIGNSFSQDTMWHLEEIARSEGYTDVKLGTLYIGGSSLKTNWTKADGDLPDYRYYYNYDGNWKNTGGQNFAISQALAEQDWDIVTLQQSSGSSGQGSTYEPYLGNLVEYVQANEPGAKIVWNMTWAYSQDSSHESFPNYNNDQMTMYNGIVGATQNVVAPYVAAGRIEKIIPCGTAIQNARTSYIGDEFDRDGYHLNIMGRIVTACTWYSVLTDSKLDELSVNYFDDSHIGTSATLTDADKAMILEAVNNAIAEPYQVTAFSD